MVRRLPLTLRVLGSYAACLLLLTACGGGGGGGTTSTGDDDPVDVPPTPTNVSFLQAEEAGFRRNISIAGAVTDDGFAIVGDDAADVGVRAVMRFAPSATALPDGVTIVKVELRLPQTAVVGMPYTGIGPIEAALIDLGAAVNFPDDYDSAFIDGLGTLSTDATLEMKVLDVTSVIKTRYDAGTRVFDVRLQRPGVSNNDQLVDSSNLNDPANLPAGVSLGGLFIEYTPAP
ncbi:MAG: hypothetical protein GY946_04520 [bacterium]|nr:hypothetical protein [bacterium]